MEEDGFSKLHYFVGQDYYPDRVRELLAEGMDPNQQDVFGNTPLHTAAESPKQSTLIVRELISAGANVNLINNEGYTPLHYAAFRRKSDMVEALLHSGADVNARTPSGNGALHYTINKYRVELLRRMRAHELLSLSSPDMLTLKVLLQDPNVDVNAVGRGGETPLMCAIVCGHIAVAEALLIRGANPNISNVHDRSPLHMAFAVRNPSLLMAYLLLRHGANVCALNGENQTPIDFLIDGIKDDHSLEIAKRVVKRLAIHNNISGKLKKVLERHSELSLFLKRCSAEVEQMKNEVISHQLTVHDFYLECFNEEQFINVLTDIYKPLVDILMTGCYSVYLNDLLECFEKYELWRVLRYHLYFENRVERFRELHRTERLRALANHILSNRISHFGLYELILTRSNLTDIQISSITSLTL